MTDARPGWLQRHPLLAVAGAAAAFLSLAQATFLILRNRSYLGPEMAAGLTKLAVIVSVVTVLLLLPVALLARRFLPSWRAGDGLGASWTVLFGITAAMVAWMIAGLLTSVHSLPRAVGRYFD